MGVVSQSPLAMLLLVTPYTIIYLVNQRKETSSSLPTFLPRILAWNWRGVVCRGPFCSMSYPIVVAGVEGVAIAGCFEQERKKKKHQY